MRHYYLLSTIFFSVLFSGCSSLGPVFKYKEVSSKKITYNTFSLEIQDKRTNVSDKSIYLNPITFGGEYSKVSPKLPSVLDSIYTSVIEEYKRSGDYDIKIVIEILEAYQKFHFNGFHEVENVKTVLKLKIIEQKTGNVIRESNGESWGEKKTFEATYKRINRMFLTSLKQALIIALNED